MSQVEITMDARSRALELVECNIIWPTTMLIACLKYMSQDDVEDMLRINGFEEELDYE